MNWIEEAEKRQELKEQILTEEEKKLIQNREENIASLEPSIQEFRKLVKRVGNIDPAERAPSKELDFTHHKGEAKYEFYGSANLPKKGLPVTIITSKNEVLCWRRVHFRVTDKAGIIKVNLYEQYNPEKKGQKIETIKNKFLYRIHDIDSDQIMRMLEWITFRISTSEFYSTLPTPARGAKSKKDKRCFIATAVYGTPDCTELDLLRDFRDEHLLTNIPGKAFVKAYYFVSPPIANWIEDKQGVRNIVKKLLVQPAAKLAERKVKN